MRCSLQEILAAIDPDLAGADEDDKKASTSDSQRRRKQPTAAWVEEDDSDDEVLDLLGPAAAQAIKSNKPKVKKTPKDRPEDEEEDGYSIDPVSGKLLIVEDTKADRAERQKRKFPSNFSMHLCIRAFLCYKDFEMQLIPLYNLISGYIEIFKVFPEISILLVCIYLLLYHVI